MDATLYHTPEYNAARADFNEADFQRVRAWRDYSRQQNQNCPKAKRLMAAVRKYDRASLDAIQRMTVLEAN